MRETWQDESRGLVRLASRFASAVRVEGGGRCSADEVDSDKGKLLLERAMENILEVA